MSRENITFFDIYLNIDFFYSLCYDFRMMKEDKKIHWLTRRLEELGKSKRQLALALGVQPVRMNDLEKGLWKFQASHIRKAAEYLQFDRTAFLDFLAGDITEDELWNYKPPVKISEEDLKLLNAVKSYASHPTREEAPSVIENTSQPPAIPAKDNGRQR